MEKLLVGTRDRTNLVGGVRSQVERVRSALAHTSVTDIPVAGMLCFVDGDWPLIGGDFSVDGMRVCWPRKAAEFLVRSGDFDADTVQHVHRTLA